MDYIKLLVISAILSACGGGRSVVLVEYPPGFGPWDSLPEEEKYVVETELSCKYATEAAKEILETWYPKWAEKVEIYGIKSKVVVVENYPGWDRTRARVFHREDGTVFLIAVMTSGGYGPLFADYNMAYSSYMEGIDPEMTIHRAQGKFFCEIPN